MEGQDFRIGQLDRTIGPDIRTGHVSQIIDQGRKKNKQDMTVGGESRTGQKEGTV